MRTAKCRQACSSAIVLLPMLHRYVIGMPDFPDPANLENSAKLYTQR